MIDSWSSIKQVPYEDYKFHVENLQNQPATSFSSTDKLKPKFCAICGDETNCLHYDVVSCNRCKIFFKRSLIDKRAYGYVCKRNRKCDIEAGVRCQACRFTRCVLAGMNPDAIQFPDNIDVEQIKMDLVSRKRSLENQKHQIALKVQPKFEQTLYSREIDSLLYLELKLKRLRESSYDPTHESVDIRSILRCPSELKNADKYEIHQEWPISLDEFFKDVDQKKICSFHDELDSLLNVEPKHWLAVDLILIVEVAKALPFFDKLNEDDKVTLLEHITLVNAVLLQSFYSVQKNSTTLLMPDGFTPIAIGIRKFNKMPGKLELEVFCRCIETLQRIGLNTTEYVLLKTIVYCYSYIDELSSYAREILNKEREKYAFTLLRYMQAQLGTMEGAKKYAEVISLVETFFYFAQRNRELHVIICLSNTELTMPPIIEKVLLK